ncbi:MAG: hypothetical protein O3C21_03515 [Verrucomicrobia bacterium]|nr:hypothetical protein [Verrucomicrobiota bacterium]
MMHRRPRRAQFVGGQWDEATAGIDAMRREAAGERFHLVEWAGAYAEVPHVYASSPVTRRDPLLRAPGAADFFIIVSDPVSAGPAPRLGRSWTRCCSAGAAASPVAESHTCNCRAERLQKRRSSEEKPTALIAFARNDATIASP